jgi:hypothetical protein
VAAAPGQSSLAATLALMLVALAGGGLALWRWPRHPASGWIALVTLVAWCRASTLHDWLARPGTLPIATFLLAVLGIPCIPRGAIQVKGVHHPVRVYEARSPEPT